MEIIKMTLYAQAYYSNAEYYEEIYLPKDFCEKIEESVPVEISVGELDGKHSDVYGEVDWSTLEANLYNPKTSDSDRLFYTLVEEASIEESELKQQIEIADTYLKSLDREIILPIRINSKYRELVIKEIEKLEKLYN